MYYTVEIYYQGRHNPDKDVAIEKAMLPLKAAGAGYLFVGRGRRDMQFIDRDKIKLQAAVAKVKKLFGVHVTRISAYTA